jgi:hypothetical protein
MSKNNIPSGAFLNNTHPREARAMEEILIHHQMRPLKIEYSIMRDQKSNEIMIKMPTSIAGELVISPSGKSASKNRRLFSMTPTKELRFPNGNFVKSGVKEMVQAKVEFISHGEHEDATYLIEEPNLEEVIDTAIECLAQIDSVYLILVPKIRRPRRGKRFSQEKENE